MTDLYLICNIIFTALSIAYTLWERHNIKQNKARIYELQQLSLDSYYNIKLIQNLLLQYNIKYTSPEELEKAIPPEILAEIAKYKLDIKVIKKPR